jgi:hypothetical protein
MVLVLFIIALIAAFVHSRAFAVNFEQILLRYIVLINMGIMGMLAAYAHIFMGPEIAKEIGWEPGSPFQYEVGVANLSYGVLGIMAFWMRRRFLTAAVIGWSVFLLGAFVGHMSQYFGLDNTAPYNIGLYVWINDLFLPILALVLTARTYRPIVQE